MGPKAAPASPVGVAGWQGVGPLRPERGARRSPLEGVTEERQRRWSLTGGGRQLGGSVRWEGMRRGGGCREWCSYRPTDVFPGLNCGAAWRKALLHYVVRGRGMCRDLCSDRSSVLATVGAGDGRAGAERLVEGDWVASRQWRAGCR